MVLLAETPKEVLEEEVQGVLEPGQVCLSLPILRTQLLLVRVERQVQIAHLTPEWWDQILYLALLHPQVVGLALNNKVGVVQADLVVVREI